MPESIDNVNGLRTDSRPTPTYWLLPSTLLTCDEADVAAATDEGAE